MGNQAVEDCIRRLVIVEMHLRNAGMNGALYHISAAIDELRSAFGGTAAGEEPTCEA
jgi:hypothetical protein